LRNFSTSEVVLTQWSRIDRLILHAAFESDNEDTYSRDFTLVVIKICQQLGCKLPSKELFSVLFEFHNKYFSDITLSSIKLAFELHLLGEIVDDKGDKIKHFQNFDCEFYSSIIIRYKKLLSGVVANARKEISEIEFETKKISNSINNDNFFLNQILEDFNKKEVVFFVIKYEILVEYGLLNITRKKKKEYMLLGEAFVKKQMINMRIDFKKGTEINYIVDIKINAKRLAYMDFISNKENYELVKLKINNLNYNGII